MKVPLLKTNMERLLFAINRYHTFDEGGSYHWDQSNRARSLDKTKWHRNQGIIMKVKANFWHKVVNYYAAKIKGADYFITRYL